MKYQRTIYIGEHVFERPPLPKKRSDILFYDLPKEEAYWKRQDVPEVFLKFIPNYTELNANATLTDTNGLLASLNLEDSSIVINFYKQEIERRKNGVFFKNGDEIEYLTGHHYFMLQWCKLFGVKEDYGRYMEFQRDVFYLIEHVWNGQFILGLFLSKAKKTGITQLFSCYYLNKSTMTRMQQMGIMSKKQDDAIDTNMMYYFHAFDGLPNAFKPTIESMAREEGSIKFGAKIFRGTDAKKYALSQTYQESALKTRVFAAPTKPRGFDAPVMDDEWFDEIPKYLQESHVHPKEVFETNNAAVKKQADIYGKAWLTSYTPEEDDAGFQETKIIYDNSKLHTKRGTNKTKSELICHHIPALYSYMSLIDKYGKCNEKEANKIIEEELQRVKGDPRSYQSIKRQLARNEREAWESGGAKSVFNIINLTSHLYDLEEEINQSPEPLGKPAYMEWENKLWEVGKKDRRPRNHFCNVRLIKLTEDDIMEGKAGRFTIYQDIPAQLANDCLRYGRDDNGNLIAPNRFVHIGGVDPTQYAAGKEVMEGSKNAAYTLNFHNELLNAYNKAIQSKVIISRYFFRPDAANESFEDILKDIIYYSKLVVVEANAPYVATRLIEEGMGNFMIVRNKEGVLVRWKPWMKIGEDFNLIKRTANQDQNDLMETLVGLIANYIATDEEFLNYLKTIKDPELIKQLIHFDPKNTQVFDLVMAFGYALLAYQIYYQSLFEHEDYNDVKNITAILSALAV